MLAMLSSGKLVCGGILAVASEALGIMLVLSRKVGQQILIGDGIVVTLVRISPKAVRIGIEAPKGVSIARDDRPAIIAPEPKPSAPTPCEKE